MDGRLITAIIVLVGVPAILVGYIYLTEILLRFAPERARPRLRPWYGCFRRCCSYSCS